MPLRLLSPACVLASGLCAVILGACGGGDGSAEDQIRKVIERYEEALSDRDATTICQDVLAPSTVAKNYPRNGCEDELGALLDKQISEPVHIEVISITVNGDLAKAAIEDTNNVLTFRREDGRWYLDFRNPR